jgi:hypothetical protein
MDMQDLIRWDSPELPRANMRGESFSIRKPFLVFKINAITGRCKGRADSMTTITDDFMRQMMARTKEYCVVILKAGPNLHNESAMKTIWEHARRNFALREEGVLSMSVPLRMAAT